MKQYLTTLTLSIILVLAAMSYALAAPYLVSNSYPAGDIQPESFTIVLNGTTYACPISKDAGGLVYVKFDLAGKWASGSNSVKACANSMWGSSAYTVPLAFFCRCTYSSFWAWLASKLTGKCK